MRPIISECELFLGGWGAGLGLGVLGPLAGARSSSRGAAMGWTRWAGARVVPTSCRGVVTGERGRLGYACGVGVAGGLRRRHRRIAVARRGGIADGS